MTYLKENSKGDVNILRAKKKLGDIILRLGDLECQKNQFKNALVHYKKAQVIREEIEDKKLSRGLAEVYFLIGNAYLYENSATAEVEALKFYQLARQILINNLCKALNVPTLTDDLKKSKIFDQPNI